MIDVHTYARSYAGRAAFPGSNLRSLILYREKCSNTISCNPRYVRHFESVDERWRDRSNVLPRNNESDLRRYRRKVLRRDGSIDTGSRKV